MKKSYQSESPVTITMYELLEQKEFDILESKDESVKNRIDKITKDLGINWCIDTSSDKPTCSISRTYNQQIGDEEENDLAMAAVHFLNAINEIKLPNKKSHKKEEEKVNCDNEPTIQQNEDVEFVKSLLKDIPEKVPTSDFTGIAAADLLVSKEGIPFYYHDGRIGMSLLRKMCEAFIKTYE